MPALTKRVNRYFFSLGTDTAVIVRVYHFSAFLPYLLRSPTNKLNLMVRMPTCLRAHLEYIHTSHARPLTRRRPTMMSLLLLLKAQYSITAPIPKPPHTLSSSAGFASIISVLALLNFYFPLSVPARRSISPLFALHISIFLPLPPHKPLHCEALFLLLYYSIN